jgi:hypothetical protein
MRRVKVLQREASMSGMVRKDVYIHRRQQILLRRLSQARGVSESEIVRQAIDREATTTGTPPALPDRAAWKEILDFAEARKALGADGERYEWKREGAHEERELGLQSASTE